MWPRPLVLNEPIIANQRTNSTFFDNIDLESPEIITASGLTEVETKTRD